ncbi:MAG: hypothetical protein P4M05_10950 [Bradyrhizobium sp.]|nr:hypothetical protein [Bradyrhizobium sp.]
MTQSLKLQATEEMVRQLCDGWGHDNLMARAAAAVLDDRAALINALEEAEAALNSKTFLEAKLEVLAEEVAKLMRSVKSAMPAADRAALVAANGILEDHIKRLQSDLAFAIKSRDDVIADMRAVMRAEIERLGAVIKQLEADADLTDAQIQDQANEIAQGALHSKIAPVVMDEMARVACRVFCFNQSKCSKLIHGRKFACRNGCIKQFDDATVALMRAAITAAFALIGGAEIPPEGLKATESAVGRLDTAKQENAWPSDVTEGFSKLGSDSNQPHGTEQEPVGRESNEAFKARQEKETEEATRLYNNSDPLDGFKNTIRREAFEEAAEALEALFQEEPRGLVHGMATDANRTAMRAVVERTNEIVARAIGLVRALRKSEGK